MSKIIYNNNNLDLFDPIIRNSLEYYDSHREKIQNIINDVEYIELINNNNLTDKIIFYDSNKKKILESQYEILSIYVPEKKIWKWSWSVPSSHKKHTFITRKFLDYAFDLNPKNNDIELKSILINSKIKILNNLQLDIYKALSAYLSKKPFIFKLHIAPLNIIEDYDIKSNLYPFKKIEKYKDINKLISIYLFILDY